MIINYHISPDSISLSSNGEEYLLKVLAPRSSTFIDVGANTGQWTERVLRLAPPDRKVVLFEPGVSAMNILRQRFLNMPGVELKQMAVGDVPGVMEFYEEPNAGQTSSLVAEFSGKEAQRREVAITTIDLEVEKLGWGTVDFLKIDAEGYDYHVLRGAQGLLSAGRVGVIQFEYNKPWADAGATLAGAVKLLNRSGYKVFLLRATGLHSLKFDLYREYFGYSNFVAVAPSVLPLLSDFIGEEV